MVEAVKLCEPEGDMMQQEKEQYLLVISAMLQNDLQKVHFIFTSVRFSIKKKMFITKQ